MRMLKAVAVVCCLGIAPGASAQNGGQSGGWQPSPGYRQIAIWPGAAPDPQPVKGPETVAVTGKSGLVAGRPYTYVSNVTRPTMTVYSPKGKNTGVAVVVFPGGGYQILAIDLEGTEVCDWLTARGIACVLLKYRVTDVGPYPKSGPYPESPMALEDAQRTLGLVRDHAAEWHIDPNKIGVLGFSAGGGMVAQISTYFQKRLYPAVDAADRVSCRPDFAAAIYPGHISIAFAEGDADAGTRKFPLHIPPGTDEDLGLSPYVPITRETPPTFLVQAEDDHTDGVDQALAYFIALKKAGVSAEMHLYAQGGHAFGLRPTRLPITHWPELMETWLHTIGMLPED
jgi:acetyl esterase/lipase